MKRWSGASKEIVIEDCEPEVLDIVVNYMYGIEIPDLVVRRQLSDISCQIGQLSVWTTVSAPCGQLSDRTTVSDADNCQWGQLSVAHLSADHGQLSVETVSALKKHCQRHNGPEG